MQVVEEELQIHKHMKAVVEMENSGVIHMLKHNKMEGLLKGLVIAGIIGTLSNENVDVPDVKNGNRKLIVSLFQCLASTNSHSGSENKGIQIRCVRRKYSIKRYMELPVAIHDVRDFSVLIAYAH